jgi:hypothetical protein
MTAYEVYQKDKRFFVKGLKDGDGDDQMLLHHIPYPDTETPEVENPESTDAMHGALYDMYQWHEGLKEGDTFSTPFGNFKCVSFHVVKA